MTPRGVAGCALVAATGCAEAVTSGDRGARAIDTFVAGEPDVSIGVVKGEAPYLFSAVSDATRQEDGTIVVANCSSGEVRWFDDEGRFIRSVGRRGQGPGEYTFLRRIFRLGGDTLGTFDGLNANRITILAPDGDVVRTITLGPVVAALPDVLGRLSNGTFVARLYDRVTNATPDVPFRMTMSLVLIDSTGQRSDSVSGLPGADQVALGQRGPFVNARLGRGARFAVRDDRIFYGAQDSTGIVAFGPDLERFAVTRTITTTSPITDAAKREFEAMRGAMDDRPPDGVGAVFGPAWAPEMPAFGDIVAGRDGRLWVQDPPRPNHHPLVWTAYDDGGDAVARVEIPPRFFPFEFGRDWVLGVSFDDLTIERIELRPLVPGELPGRVLTPREAQPPAFARCGAWASR
jgi:hypothetical protein